MKSVFLPLQIPIYGLNEGIHNYTFGCDHGFFEAFEDSLIHDGDFEVKLVLDKKSTLIELNFQYIGSVTLSCDRCLAPITFPLETQSLLYLKYSDSEKESEDEIVFIKRDTDHYNVADHIHETLCLSLPISVRIDCESMDPKPCDMKVLSKLIDNSRIEEQETNPLWDTLKNIEIKKQ
jgi:uncharacterized protein